MYIFLLGSALCFAIKGCICVAQAYEGALSEHACLAWFASAYIKEAFLFLVSVTFTIGTL